MLKKLLKEYLFGTMLWSKTRSGRGGTRLSGMCRPKIDRLSTAISTDRSADTTTVNKIQLSWVKVKRLENPGGGGNSAYERGRDARRKFCIKPLKETDLGVAQEFFDP